MDRFFTVPSRLDKRASTEFILKLRVLIKEAAKKATWNGKKSIFECDPERWITDPASFFGGLVQV
ncbi:hypothetical protein BpHYR1_047236 [Brachionus plicatilis]|uniref:Uncharacterized protein n=1 Tax=Brachionus plicatilis TaxID=10195 RepID=A0A3M7QSM1_BRAPC|nr:hypothetical protein BpHYR1_047236 [Brachionus plicatilis]